MTKRCDLNSHSKSKTGATNSDLFEHIQKYTSFLPYSRFGLTFGIFCSRTNDTNTAQILINTTEITIVNL